MKVKKAKFIYEKITEDKTEIKEYTTKNNADYNRVKKIFKDMSETYKLISEKILEEEKEITKTVVPLMDIMPVYPYKG